MKKYLVLILSFFSFSLQVSAISNYVVPSTETVDKDTVTLSKCVDGDTARFILNGEEIKVRFLAVDTPESTNEIELYGKDAAEFTCDRLTNAEVIELEYDKNSDRTDKYDRYLAWIIVDGKNLQLELVKQGYAEVKYIYGDYKYLDEIEKAQKEAQKDKLNIWADYQNQDYYTYIYIGIGVVLIIICIVTKNRRVAKKIFNKIKREIK